MPVECLHASQPSGPVGAVRRGVRNWHRNFLVAPQMDRNGRRQRAIGRSIELGVQNQTQDHQDLPQQILGARP